MHHRSRGRRSRSSNLLPIRTMRETETFDTGLSNEFLLAALHTLGSPLCWSVHQQDIWFHSTEDRTCFIDRRVPTTQPIPNTNEVQWSTTADDACLNGDSAPHRKHGSGRKGHHSYLPSVGPVGCVVATSTPFRRFRSPRTSSSLKFTWPSCGRNGLHSSCAS